MDKQYIAAILSQTQHRPFPVQAKPWKYYQEWHDVIFAHWKLPVPVLQPLIPVGLELDLYEGDAWVSLVAFSIVGLRPRYFPSLSLLSDFHEINLRTYVTRNGKPGIYFFSLEAEKLGSSLMSKLISGLPYMKSSISRKANLYESENEKMGFRLSISYRPQGKVREKSPLERWLLERYCLFHHLSGRMYGIDIHHMEWPMQDLEIEKQDIQYRLAGNTGLGEPDLFHYAEGVQVLTWGKKWT
jgi:uncharacterized protein